MGAKPTALSKVTEKRRFEKGVYQKKIELARKNRRIAVEKKKKIKQIRQNFGLDLWGEHGNKYFFHHILIYYTIGIKHNGTTPGSITKPHIENITQTLIYLHIAFFCYNE